MSDGERSCLGGIARCDDSEARLTAPARQKNSGETVLASAHGAPIDFGSEASYSQLRPLGRHSYSPSVDMTGKALDGPSSPPANNFGKRISALVSNVGLGVPPKRTFLRNILRNHLQQRRKDLEGIVPSVPCLITSKEATPFAKPGDLEPVKTRPSSPDSEAFSR